MKVKELGRQKGIWDSFLIDVLSLSYLQQFNAVLVFASKQIFSDGL